MRKRIAIFLLYPIAVLAQGQLPPPGSDGPSQRAYQVAILNKIAEPLVSAGSEAKLRTTLLGAKDNFDNPAPLEAVGRILTGIAPWLELGPSTTPEGRLRERYIQQVVKMIENSVNPNSPDYLNFTRKHQALVDTAFFAHGLLRAPTQLWANLNETTQAQVIDALKASRVIPSRGNNWRLFSAMVEVALWEFTGECEMAPIEKAVNDHLEWYKGDGAYGDGKWFHWDYYNSLVIHPMLLDILEVSKKKGHPLAEHLPLVQERAVRYAHVLEMQISPEGTFPVIGRSSTYRIGAFQHLSMMALRHQLPEAVTPGGVRAALNQVIHRMMEAPGTFDNKGLLTRGVIGNQPRMAEGYINGGSVYLCLAAFLQLGLPEDDAFWTDAPQAWTQKKIWAGENTQKDSYIKDKK